MEWRLGIHICKNLWIALLDPCHPSYLYQTYILHVIHFLFSFHVIQLLHIVHINLMKLLSCICELICCLTYIMLMISYQPMDRFLTSLIVGSLGFFPMYLDNTESKSSLHLSKRFLASCKQSACVTMQSVSNRIYLDRCNSLLHELLQRFNKSSLDMCILCHPISHWSARLLLHIQTCFDTFPLRVMTFQTFQVHKLYPFAYEIYCANNKRSTSLPTIGSSCDWPNDTNPSASSCCRKLYSA